MSLRTPVVWAKAKGFYRGKPFGHGRRGQARSERCGARGGRSKVFLSVGVNKTISRGFSARPFDSDHGYTYILFFFCREISVRAPHGSPKLCDFLASRETFVDNTQVWVRCASCVTDTLRMLCAALSRVCRPCSVPGFQRKAFTLMGFLQDTYNNTRQWLTLQPRLQTALPSAKTVHALSLIHI